MSTSEDLALIFNKLPTAYAVVKPTRPSFPIIKVNDAYRDLITPNENHITGKNFLDIYHDHLITTNNKNKADVESTLEKVTTEKTSLATNVVKIASQNADPQKHCISKFKPITNDAGDLIYILHTIEDLTDKLSSEEKRLDIDQMSSRSKLHVQNENLANQLSKKIVQYETASKELDDFVYSVSHDLRAPLRRIDGFSQELINEYIDQLDEMGAHYLKRVRQGAQDMGNLIDDLLKLSRISRRTVNIESVNITDLAQTIYNELLELEPEREIEFSVEDGLTTQADPGLTKAMLINLIANALKFTSKEKNAILKIGLTQNNDEDYFFINDNGVGFDPEYSEKLFKAFDRLHSQKEFQGSGIGLATVKRIINLHGGDIKAKSTPGQGATFYFRFQKT